MSDTKKIEELTERKRVHQKEIRDIDYEIRQIERDERLSRCPTVADLEYYYHRYYGGIEGNVTFQGIISVTRYTLTKYIDTVTSRIRRDGNISSVRDCLFVLEKDRDQLKRPGDGE